LTLKPLHTLRSPHGIVVDFPERVSVFWAAVKYRAVILVAVDDASLRTTMSAFLTLKNFFPIGADNMANALKVLGGEHIDAVVLDLRLSDPTGQHGSGLNLLAFLRATVEYAHVPVIVVAAAPLSHSELETVRAHGARLFYKTQPFTTLLNYLNRLVDTSAAS
jgi:DNA-binding response OmpR family regulator